MANDRAVGGAIFIASIVGIVIYGLLIYYWPVLVLEITAFVAIAVVLAILAWIGWTMASTPPPEPITAIPDVTQPTGTKPQDNSQADGTKPS